MNLKKMNVSYIEIFPWILSYHFVLFKFEAMYQSFASWCPWWLSRLSFQMCNSASEEKELFGLL